MELKKKGSVSEILSKAKLSSKFALYLPLASQLEAISEVVVFWLFSDQIFSGMVPKHVSSYLENSDIWFVNNMFTYYL